MAKINMVLLEGTDNSGKSTVAKILSSHYADSVLLRDPEYFRGVLNDPEISPRTRFYLHLAAREELLDKHIFPAVDAGKFIIQDRLHISTNVYQGEVSDIPIGEIAAIDDRMLKGLRYLPVILVTTVETLLKREIDADQSYWENSGKLEQILRGYLRYASTHNVPVIWTDSKTPEEVADEIINTVLFR